MVNYACDSASDAGWSRNGWKVNTKKRGSENSIRKKCKMQLVAMSHESDGWIKVPNWTFWLKKLINCNFMSCSFLTNFDWIFWENLQLFNCYKSLLLSSQENFYTKNKNFSNFHQQVGDNCAAPPHRFIDFLLNWTLSVSTLLRNCCFLPLIIRYTSTIGKYHSTDHKDRFNWIF